jgi:hypothetical protein
MEIKLFIHVGARKTATTWLQEIIFKNSALNYLGKTKEDYPDWLIRWHYLDDLAFENEKHKIKEIIYKLLKPNVPNLISSEAFTNTAVIFNQALRIKYIFPEAKIIFSIRDPIEVIISHYRHVVGEGIYFLGVKSYLDWRRTPFDLFKRKPIYLPDFFYDEIIESYQKLFGINNLCILRYEDLINNPAAYFQKLGEFVNTHFEDIEEKIKIKVNEGLSISELKFKKTMNFKNFLNTHFPHLSLKVQVDDLAKDVGAEIIDDELRGTLKQYFRGKCAGYY